jgi:hypothetical protein
MAVMGEGRRDREEGCSQGPRLHLEPWRVRATEMLVRAGAAIAAACSIPPPYPGLANKLSAGATQDGLRKVRFALDSSLEGAGSEPSAPLEAARRRRQIPPRPHLAAQDGGYIKAG